MAKILIAEDDSTVRSLIHMTLDSGQTEILEVEDGTAALEVARSELPELIFLDWSMPPSLPDDRKPQDAREACR
jgi:CheY-like chemotaxis protein